MHTLTENVINILVFFAVEASTLRFYFFRIKVHTTLQTCTTVHSTYRENTFTFLYQYVYLCLVNFLYTWNNSLKIIFFKFAMTLRIIRLKIQARLVGSHDRIRAANLITAVLHFSWSNKSISFRVMKM